MAEAPLRPDASPAELASILARIRQQPAEQHPPGFYDQALAWLNHSHETVREQAIVFLGRHFRQRRDAQPLLEMVVADPSASVRKAAADCLGGVFRATRNLQVNEVLAIAARSTQEEGAVRAAAFAAIKRINGY